jgi:hypothetical protein
MTTTRYKNGPITITKSNATHIIKTLVDGPSRQTLQVCRDKPNADIVFGVFDGFSSIGNLTAEGTASVSEETRVRKGVSPMLWSEFTKALTTGLRAEYA